MRHRKAGLKLNRTSSHRKAMFRNMVTSLFKHDRIRTTDVKAKEVRRWADNLITLAKRGDLHARRQALAIIREKQVVHKLFEEASERFGAVAGGYTRVVKLGRRAGDAAPISLVELISLEPAKKKKTKKKKKAKAPEAPKPAVETAAAEEEKAEEKVEAEAEVAKEEVAAEEPVEAAAEEAVKEDAEAAAEEEKPQEQAAAPEAPAAEPEPPEAEKAEDAKEEGEPKS